MLHRTDDFIMNALWRCYNARVSLESSADGEVEPVPANIADLASCFTDDDVAGSMIPDLLLVVCTDLQPQVYTPQAQGQRHVLCLRVQADGRLSDVQLPCDKSVFVMG